MIGMAAPRIISFSDLQRWDVKYFLGQIKSKYPLVSLAEFVTEHNKKIRPYDSPQETFKILGVNNTDGIFHAYDALGKEVKQPYKKVSAGDFAYNPYRINVGSIGWVPPEHDGAYISPAYVVFSVDKTVVLPEVFWFILKSAFFNQTLRAATAGSVRMNLTYPLLETLKIPIPPLPVQQEIVAYWEDALAHQQRLLAKKVEIRSECRSFILNSLGIKRTTPRNIGKVFCLNWANSERWSYEFNKRVLSGLAEVPTGQYQTVILGELCRGQSGSTPSKKNLSFWNNGEVPWVSPKDMKAREISDAIDHITTKAVEDHQAPIVPERSILFVVRSGILQKMVPVAVTRERLSINQDMRAYTPKSGNVLPDFLLAYFEAKQEELLRLVKWSTTVQSINKEELESFPVPLPPIEIQKKIVSSVNEFQTEINNCDTEYKRSISFTNLAIEQMILGLRPVEGT